jgi:hypothetical protein
VFIGRRFGTPVGSIFRVDEKTRQPINTTRPKTRINLSDHGESLKYGLNVDCSYPGTQIRVPRWDKCLNVKEDYMKV